MAHEPVIEPLPVRALGFALCGLGCLGLLKQILLLLLCVPLAVWASLAILLSGIAVLVVDKLKQLLAEKRLHRVPGEFLRSQMQGGQCVYLLAFLTEPSREDVSIILSGLSPMLAELALAEDLRQAFAALARPLLQAWHIGEQPDADSKRCNAGISEAERQSPENSSSSSSSSCAVVAVAEEERVAEAVAWLKGSRIQLNLGFADQLQLYGLAQQAIIGDAPASAGTRREAGLARAKRQSWERHRGLSRVEAGHRLVEELAELDPVFGNTLRARPSGQEVVQICRSPGQPFYINLVCMVSQLLQRRLPVDASERAAKGKRQALRLFLASLVALTLLRRSKLPRRLLRGAQQLPLATMLAASSCSYLCAITFGLPAGIHLWLPKALRDLPTSAGGAAEAVFGKGPTPSMVRWAVQQLLPPVSRPLLQDSEM